MSGREGPDTTALVRKRADTNLMPPPPPPKRIQRPKTVLDEDTYADGLSKIIARDFFPGLVESEAQNEYLNALDSKDDAWISSAGRRLREVMTPGRRRRSRVLTASFGTMDDGRPGATPMSFAGDTPASVRSVGTTASEAEAAAGQKEKGGVDVSVSLASFQAKYTSEDNESFYKLLDKQNVVRAEKHAWLWHGNKLPSKMQIKQREVETRLVEAGVSLVDDGFDKRDRLAIRDGDERPAAPESWTFSAKNALMFHPDGVADTAASVAARAQAEARAGPRTIVYGNTRLPGTSLLAQQQQQEQQERASRGVPPSPTLSAVRDALAGQPRRADRDSMAGSTIGDGGGGETPRVNGYSFVDDEEPEPEPEPEPAEPIVKFGHVDATPNPFQLQAKSKREGLHHRMVERIAQSKRTSARVGATGRIDSGSPLVKYPRTPRMRGGLTPAGQRLWSKIGGGGPPDDAVSAFNADGGRKQNAHKGSRRARLREQRRYR